MEICNEGVENLRYAIVKQAISDYYRARLVLGKIPVTKYKHALECIKDCEPGGGRL